MSREELLDIAVVRQWGEFRNDNMLCVLGFQSLYRPGTSPLHCDGKKQDVCSEDGFRQMK